ncbi:UDP-glucuronate 4-epimerase 4-like [Elaeis guineensis]|uniref:UDP-glucuronate 4-epimerase 4-like n=1 Tax=Elaeis guineensis var. tenera TaxID=51953 RepID=A0A6I9Q7W6_ELAGV|nr:UDP-glucuronate 4-epimerase 4-like [Elaeis guineensis]
MPLSLYNPSLKHACWALLLCTGVFIINGNLSDPNLFNKLLDIVSFTHVLRLASLPADAPLGHLNPAVFAYVDVEALISLFKPACAIDSSSTIIWVSSTFVYGLNPTSTPIVESNPIDHLATLFASGKNTTEEIAYAYRYTYGLSITTLHLFTDYNP